MTLISQDRSKPSPDRGAVFSLEGKGFHTGKTNRLELSAWHGGNGWIEVGSERHAVWGLGSKPSAMGRCTASEGVGPLEHLSAAALCQGVGGWLLKADHGDLPLFDGSARIWQEAFSSISGSGYGVRVESVDLEATRWESARGGILAVEPSDRFRLRVDWSAGPDGPETWEGGESELCQTLAARTFVDVVDWLAARNQGFLQGTDATSGRLLRLREPTAEAIRLACQLGIQPEKRVWTGGDARMPDECAAHKAMDLAGDIGCWIGYLPKLSIHARDTGHDLHHLLGSALRGSIGEV